MFSFPAIINYNNNVINIFWVKNTENISSEIKLYIIFFYQLAHIFYLKINICIIYKTYNKISFFNEIDPFFTEKKVEVLIIIKYIKKMHFKLFFKTFKFDDY